MRLSTGLTVLLALAFSAGADALAQTAGLDLPANELPGLTGNGPAGNSPQPESESRSEPVLEGPLKERRLKIKTMIEDAGREGVGTRIYSQALDAVEAMVRTGGSEALLSQRLDSIENSLNEQFKRRRILKYQKPAPPIAASSPPPSQLEQAGRGNDRLKGVNKDGLIEAITDKWFGGDLPDSIKSKIPANVDPSMLKGQDLDKLMKKLNK
ncbi:MAG: hypothetical protein IPM23_20700 [Candidatus Melainabacteria bacterium]|nr:hypothetical protein [Candidatus Melainabacteria bacterium]